MPLDIGDRAVEFVLPDSTGQDLRLSALAGNWVVLWWFPRAGSPGCTVQSRGVEVLAREYRVAPVRFVGISVDPPEANEAFCADTAPHVSFVSDTGGHVAASYRVTRPPDDPRADLPERVTYVLDPDQRVHAVLVVTDVWRHADDVRRILTGAGVVGAAAEPAAGVS